MSRSQAAPVRVFNWDDICDKAADQLPELGDYFAKESIEWNYSGYYEIANRMRATMNLIRILYLKAMDAESHQITFATRCFDQHCEMYNVTPLNKTERKVLLNPSSYVYGLDGQIFEELSHKQQFIATILLDLELLNSRLITKEDEMVWELYQ